MGSARGKPRAVRGSSKRGTWDVNRLIVAAGGPEPLRIAHAQLGFQPLSPVQISNWRTRYTIPAARLAEIFLTMKGMTKGDFDPLDYIKTEAA